MVLRSAYKTASPNLEAYTAMIYDQSKAISHELEDLIEVARLHPGERAHVGGARELARFSIDVRTPLQIVSASKAQSGSAEAKEHAAQLARLIPYDIADASVTEELKQTVRQIGAKLHEAGGLGLMGDVWFQVGLRGGDAGRLSQLWHCVGHWRLIPSDWKWRGQIGTHKITSL